MKRLLTILLAVSVTALAAYPAFATVTNSPHDFLGVSTYGRCEVCHVPHAASAITGKRLWRVDINMNVTDDNTWDSSTVGRLCGGTCHYSPTLTTPKVTQGNLGGGGAPHNVSGTVFATTSHGRTVAKLTNLPTDGTTPGVGDVPPDADTRPYIKKNGSYNTYIQCTSCHNVHDDTVRPFLRHVPSTQNGITYTDEATISQVCGGCHNRYNTKIADLNTVAHTYGSGMLGSNGTGVSMHPIDVSYDQQTDAWVTTGQRDTNGYVELRNFSITGIGPNGVGPAGVAYAAALPGGGWDLGSAGGAKYTGHAGQVGMPGRFESFSMAPLTSQYGVTEGGYSAGGQGSKPYIGCMTCHAIHNPAADPGDGTQSLYLLAVANTPNASGTTGTGYAGAPLCETCHGGGTWGAQYGKNNKAASTANPAIYVGGLYNDAGSSAPKAAANSIGTLRDHPIDLHATGTPLLDNWQNTTRAERKPTTPVEGSTDVAHWPYANVNSDPNGYKPSGLNNKVRIVCTSCHSAHDAKPGTSLNRVGTGDYGAKSSGGAGTATGVWCYSCHAQNDMIPGNHHSAQDPSKSGGGNYATSQIGCFDCHFGSAPAAGSNFAGLVAHEGFFNIRTDPWASKKGSNWININSPATNNANSELCLACHTQQTWAQAHLPGGTIADPVGGLSGIGVADNFAVVPNAHLTIVTVAGRTDNTGKQTNSHFLGSFVNGTNSINVKTGYWTQVRNFMGGTTNTKYGYSKYGGNTNTLGYYPPVVNGNSTLICESCHSILMNAGDGSMSGGYRINLLLQNYEDNTPGAVNGAVTSPANTFVPASPGPGAQVGVVGPNGNVEDVMTPEAGSQSAGSGFCVACHNMRPGRNTASGNGLVTHSIVDDKNAVPANMHPMTAWSITRAVDAGRTTGNGVHLTTTNGTVGDIATEGSFANAGSTDNGATNGSSFPDPDGLNVAPGQGSYDNNGGANSAMSCDGCHRPHRADNDAWWTPNYKAYSVPVILEKAGPTKGQYSDFCQTCHGM